MVKPRETLPGVRGLVFFGFPLHPAAKPSTDRADHLADVTVPMLFLQGTRDKLADLDLVRGVCEELGPPVELRWPARTFRLCLETRGCRSG